MNETTTQERERFEELQEQAMYGDFEADPEGEAEYRELRKKFLPYE